MLSAAVLGGTLWTGTRLQAAPPGLSNADITAILNQGEAAANAVASGAGLRSGPGLSPSGRPRCTSQ